MLVAGPCLQHITAWNKVALFGDASHPLSGAFGFGAAFAMEDGWILARALERALEREVARGKEKRNAIKGALGGFERVRGSYYERMYEYLATREKHSQGSRQEGEDFGSVIRARIAGFGFVAGGGMDWIYKNDIAQVWKEWLAGEEQEKEIEKEQAARL